MSVERIEEALLKKRLGDLGGARGLLEAVLADQPTQSWARLELTRIVFQQEGSAAALTVAQEGLRHKKDLYNVHNAVSEVHHRSGRPVEAKKAAAQAFESGGYTVNAASWYFQLLLIQGDLKAALGLLGQFLAQGSPDQVSRFLSPSLQAYAGHLLARSPSLEAWPAQAPGPALDRTLVVMVVRDEEDIVARQIRHHHRLGLRNFFLLDNRSADGTRRVLEECRSLEGITLVVVDDPEPRFFQGEKVTALARFAAEYQAIRGLAPDWVFALDADEFLVAPLPLAQVLGDLPPSVKLGLLNLRNLGASEVYGRLEDEWPLEKAFPNLQTKAMTLNPVTKAFYRYEPGAVIASGNHMVYGLIRTLDEVAFLCERGVYLNHLPIRSVEQIKKKTINGGQSIAGIEGGSHWKARYADYLRRGDEVFVDLVRRHNSNT